MKSSLSKLLLLVDYHGHFYCHHAKVTMDVERLKQAFQKVFSEIEIRRFDELYHNLDLLSSYENCCVIYTSIENAPYYKKMIESVIYILSHKNKIYPNFDVLLSHEDKIYQEYYKSFMKINSISCIVVHNFLELEKIDFQRNYVFKWQDGSGSRNVSLVANIYDVYRKCKPILIKNIQRNIEIRQTIEYTIKAKLLIFLLKISSAKKGYHLFQKKCKSLFLNDCSFVLQEFKEGYQHDFKILIYYDRIFALRRNVRKNDFRASGSGLFFTGELPSFALEFVYHIYKQMKLPILSLDVLIDVEKQDIFIIEWQGIHHGPATVALTECYYQVKENSFIKMDNNHRDVEENFAYAYINYIKNGESYEFGLRI